MARHVKDLGQRVKGSLGEKEDWWKLHRDNEGELYVEHTWSHTELKTTSSKEGEKTYTVDEFLAVDHPWAADAQEALKAYLAEHA